MQIMFLFKLVFQIVILTQGLILLDALDNFDGGIRMVTGVNGTAGIWATYPQDFVSIPTALGDQVSLPPWNTISTRAP